MEVFDLLRKALKLARSCFFKQGKKCSKVYNIGGIKLYGYTA